MNPISASSLLHFTSGIDALKGILGKGFRFSYCYEEYNNTIVFNNGHKEHANFFIGSNGTKKGVAIPMICFCDIPLLRVQEHAKCYGKYIIGIDKNYAETLYQSLNPVLYLFSNRMDLSLCDISISKENFKCERTYDYSQSVNHLIAYSKRYKGFDLYRNKETCFYDEREWRIVIPDGGRVDGLSWLWNIEFKSKDEYKEYIRPYNEKLQSSEAAYLRFIEFQEKENENHFCNFITHIVVSEDKEIPELIKYILNTKNKLFGYEDLSEDTRMILVSKITSFERIEKDF